MSNNYHGVFLTDILTEMCSRVGANYDEIDFSKDQWYLDYSWTNKEQEMFIDWFAKFLKNRGPRNELCKYPSLVRTLDERARFARQFVNEFGWRVEDKS